MNTKKNSDFELILKRLESLDEVPDYQRIIESFFSESRFSEFEIDWDTMEQGLKMAIAAKQHSAVFVILRAGELVALAQASVMNFIGVPDVKLAQIQFMHVLPEFRKTYSGGKAFKMLLNAVKGWAKEQGAIETSFDIETKYLSEQMIKLVGKQGFRQRAGRFSDGERI